MLLKRIIHSNKKSMHTGKSSSRRHWHNTHYNVHGLSYKFYFSGSWLQGYSVVLQLYHVTGPNLFLIWLCLVQQDQQQTFSMGDKDIKFLEKQGCMHLLASRMSLNNVLGHYLPSQVKVRMKCIEIKLATFYWCSYGNPIYLGGPVITSTCNLFHSLF